VSSERPPRNPFRSEADAFRLLVIIGASVATIAAAAALGGPWLGVPIAVILLGVGARASYRWLRRSIKAPNEAQSPGDDRAAEGRPENPTRS